MKTLISSLNLKIKIFIGIIKRFYLVSFQREFFLLLNFINQVQIFQEEDHRIRAMTSPSSKFVLLFRCTGLTGYHIANKLLQENFTVRVFCRSKKKFMGMFGQRINDFEDVVQGNLDNQEDLEKAFRISEKHGKIEEAISALGGRPTCNESQVEQIEYFLQKRIIDNCKKYVVKKYVLVAAALVERPWNLVTIFLNTINPNVYEYKILCENYLRNSGLDYIIIRPVGLTGKENDKIQTFYELDQGEKIVGKISRCTLACLTVDAMKNEKIPSKVTFQCKGTLLNQSSIGFKDLKEDSKESIIEKLPHRQARNTVCGICLFIILLIITLPVFLTLISQ